MTTLLRLRFAASSAMLILLLGAGAYAADGKQVLEDACSACHVQEGGKFARIDSVRKTPEAWDMTVQRMMRNHHLELTTEDRIAVVRYLAETRGLSVGETEDYRDLRPLPFLCARGPAEALAGRLDETRQLPPRPVPDHRISGAGARP
jgi:quinohemoprotein amine dehydrogenase